MNGERISVSGIGTLGNSLIATGFPYDDRGLHETYMKLLSEIQKSSHGLRRAGSAATDIAYVSCGKFEAYFEYGLQAWDMAAGALICSEAGGIVTDFSGGNLFLSKRQLLCAAPGVHAALLQRIQHYFPAS
jgi:myo-inositol-1(or 4)-monophosphatase